MYCHAAHSHLVTAQVPLGFFAKVWPFEDIAAN
jgi:hypothetical protein